MKYAKVTSIWRGGIICALAAAAVISMFAVAGCGGSGSSNNSVVTPPSGFKQVGATYVGRSRCRDCHATIDDQFGASNAHGQDFTKLDGDLVSGNGGRCAPCHTVGFGAASGFVDIATTPALAGIGCEDCHGPGSKHVAANSNAERIANITKTPDASKTCWNCHLGSFKGIETGLAPVTDDSLAKTAPKSVSQHHAQTPFLLGKLGANMTSDTPSPHSTVQNSCVACHMGGHISPTNGLTDHSSAGLVPNIDTSRAICSSCHSGGTRGTPVQSGIKAALITLGGPSATDPTLPDENAAGGLMGAYVAAHSDVLKLDGTNNAPTDPHVMAYKVAKNDYALVWEDKSYGVHNPGFAKKLIDAATAALANNP